MSNLWLVVILSYHIFPFSVDRQIALLLKSYHNLPGLETVLHKHQLFYFSTFLDLRYPTNKWIKLGTFHARDERTVQSFPLDEQLYAKYVKVKGCAQMNQSSQSYLIVKFPWKWKFKEGVFPYFFCSFCCKALPTVQCWATESEVSSRSW